MIAAQLAVAAWAVFPTSQAASALTILLAEQQLLGMRPAGTSLHVGYGPDGSVSWVAFSPDGKLPNSAHAGGTVQVLPAPPLPAHPYTVLCAFVGPPTRQEWNHYAFGEPQPKVCR